MESFLLRSAVITKVVRVLAQRAMTVLAVVRAWYEGRRKEGRKEEGRKKEEGVKKGRDEGTKGERKEGREEETDKDKR